MGAREGRRMAVGLSRAGCGCLRADRWKAVGRPAVAMPGEGGSGAEGGRARVVGVGPSVVGPALCVGREDGPHGRVARSRGLWAGGGGGLIANAAVSAGWGLDATGRAVGPMGWGVGRVLACTVVREGGSR